MQDLPISRSGPAAYLRREILAWVNAASVGNIKVAMVDIYRAMSALGMRRVTSPNSTTTSIAATGVEILVHRLAYVTLRTYFNGLFRVPVNEKIPALNLI